MASSNIPSSETLNGGGVGQNIAPINSNPAANKSGPLCQLATGVSSPIAETIQSTIATLNSLQGAVDSIVYAPAVGLNELQRKIASGEMLNDVTLKIQFSIGQLLKNAATSLATAAVTSSVGTLADKALKSTTTAVNNITTPLNNLKNTVTNTVNNVNRQVQLASAQLAAGVYKIASIPGSVITQTGAGIGGAVGGALKQTGIDINKILAGTISTAQTSFTGIVKTAASTTNTQN